MTLIRTQAALLLAILAAGVAVLTLRAQNPPVPQVPQPPTRPAPPSHPVIFLDPAHGSTDTGASLPGNIPEKDLTLAFTARLRTQLAQAGFSVITTRDADPSAPISTDDRAAIANRAHPLACLVIHATAAGSGLHLFTSTLPPQPPPDDSAAFSPTPWESAQATFVDQSRHLADVLHAELGKSGQPLYSGRAPLRPLDNLACPALAVELAPQSAGDIASIAPAGSPYQQTTAAAIVAALQAWRDQNAGGAQ